MMLKVHEWINHLFPTECVMCEKQNNDVICSHCLQQIQPLEGFCLNCGKPLKSGILHGCGNCIDKELPFNLFISLYPFSAIDRLIHRFKFHASRRAHKTVAKLIQRGLDSLPKEIQQGLQEFEVAIPIPMHWARRLTREFNHAELIAEIVSKRLEIRLRKNLLVRVKNTQQQALLKGRQRLKNVLGAFKVKEKPPPKVLLIDDVATTLATLKEAAEELKRAGAECVRCLVLARA